MAERAGTLAAGAVAATLGLLTLGTLAVVALQTGGGLRLGPADWAALRFTVWQAVLSALASVLLAVPVARALARRRFAGRGALIALLGAPFLLPVIVAVLGLLAVFGRAGLLNRGLEALGLPVLSVYGLHGVVLAHVFLNMPLAVRLILQGWATIPAERFRLAASLGFGPGDVFRHLERPMLREVLPGAVVVIFVICLTSFAVALTLGGGPRATTLELAIYQALRFEFDLTRAAVLALAQFALCAAAVLAAARLALPAGFGAGLDRTALTLAPGGWRRGLDALAIALAAGFLLAPLGAVVAAGLPGLGSLPDTVWAAAGRSVSVALASTLVSVAGALVLALAAARGARGFELAATLPLAASSLVLGTGLFLAVYPFVSPASVALPVTVLVNAALSLPFAFRVILPEARRMQADHGRLAEALGLRGMARLRWLVLPRLRRPLGFALGICAALSMGDLGVIALFAGEREATLPLLVQRLVGAYQMQAAASASLLLVALSFGLFWLFDWGGRRGAEA
ncbi:thiamine/thiamine pyrophosphate ABC transporter permease ThiP [Cereibacter changlensis JA139]|uniref:Thiamine/thiamine pyrophosphate ABC transporter permease ThiP n=2 Tax=Cereibacter changlensis TaxID=402884 RepID=A0A2T4K0P0_9RHOB|nr:thiamine/thiamine pyrophosphate ABC transporter permease ThiP [Cereibacter changlensis]PTE23696.1 thiamine/thiamine pyrophosphate ABC transporter permease ThiP [Cereibacter changlensis JA139]PZX59100.1 thiamine transport system permease protein [Cereibacter changlensis]